MSWEFAVRVHEVVPASVGAVPVTLAVSLAPTVLPEAVKEPPLAHVIVQPVIAKLEYGLPALYVALKLTGPPAVTAEGFGVVIATALPTTVNVMAPAHPASPAAAVVIPAPASP